MTVTPTSVSRICPSCHEPYPYDQPHACAGAAAAAVAPVKAPADEDALIGSIIAGRYHIESYLQSGGMGAVYKARHEVLGHQLAVKVLRMIPDQAAQQRFLLEAKTACSIGHLNIVHIVDFGVLPDRRPYLVMEYLKGQSLDSLIVRQGVRGVPPLRVCRIGEQIALGMQAVHDKGIVHRDLKPGNIFVLDMDGKDFVKILDFGIAKVMAGQRSLMSADRPAARLTQDGMVLGTPEYMAPESATAQSPDHRADQYSLGCILYEMLVGELPFEVPGNTAATMIKHVTEPPIPPRTRRPDLPIPPTLEQVVLRTLQKKPAERFLGMRELAQALAREGDLLAASNELPAVHAVPAEAPVKAAPVQAPTTVVPVQAPVLPAAPAPRELSGSLVVPSRPPAEPSAPPALPMRSDAQVQMPRSGAQTEMVAPLPVFPTDISPVLAPRWPRTALLGLGGAVVVLGLLIVLGRSHRTPASPAPAPGRAPVPAAVEPAPVKAEVRRPSPPTPVAATEPTPTPAPADDPGLARAPREHALRVTLESGNGVPIDLSCPGVARATIPPKGSYRLSLAPGKKGACQLSAKGYEDKVLPYDALRVQARGRNPSVAVRLQAL